MEVKVAKYKIWEDYPEGRVCHSEFTSEDQLCGSSYFSSRSILITHMTPLLLRIQSARELCVWDPGVNVFDGLENKIKVDACDLGNNFWKKFWGES